MQGWADAPLMSVASAIAPPQECTRMGRGSAQERCLDRRSTSEGMHGWAVVNVQERCTAHRALPGNVEGLADAALISAASAHPHTLPVTKATPNPTDSREEAAATAMG